MSNVGDSFDIANGEMNEEKPSGTISTEDKKSKIKRIIRENKLVIAIVSGALLGTVLGIAINAPIQKLEQPDRYTAIILIGFPGELLLRALKMLILPLITCSLIVGLSNLDQSVSGRIGARGVVYYMSTTVLAAILGIILVSAIRPGVGMTPPEDSKQNQLVRPLDSFMDIIRNMFPPNIVKAAVEQDKTIIEEVIVPVRNQTTYFNFTSMSANETANIIKKYGSKIKSKLDPVSGQVLNYTTHLETRKYKIGKGLTHPSKANFLGLIIFALAVGKVAGTMGERAEPFVSFITVFNEIITKLVIFIMWCAPVGIMSLICAQFAQMSNILSTFSSLGLYMVTVILGIGIHGFVVLPLIYFIFTRKNPFIFVRGLAEAMFTAFGTDSSAATLPVTFRCLEEKLGLDKRITRFILPVGATINMDGTALYEAVSAIFISQAVGVSLSFGDYVAISFTSILASVGAAAIPHAGLVTMLIVLDTVGLPSDMVGIIFTIDWFLDRCRTVVNVVGDAFGTGIVQHLSKADLEEKTVDEEKETEMSVYPMGKPNYISAYQVLMIDFYYIKSECQSMGCGSSAVAPNEIKEKEAQTACCICCIRMRRLNENKDCEDRSNLRVEAKSWSDNFEKLLKNPVGRKYFQQFLQTQFSDENLCFWVEAENYYNMNDEERLKVAKTMYADFVSSISPCEVSLDAYHRNEIEKDLDKAPKHLFRNSQSYIYSLMHRDCFPRFLKSKIYKRLCR